MSNWKSKKGNTFLFFCFRVLATCSSCQALEQNKTTFMVN